MKCFSPQPISGSQSPHLDSPEHIQRIMTLEESVQHIVMEAIQEVGGGTPCGYCRALGEVIFLG
jgi:hypothetical protein